MEPDDGQAVQSSSQTVIEAGRLSTFGSNAARFDCPFCDGFFDSHFAYLRHMRTSHSYDGKGGEVCRFRYCTAEASNFHYRMYHKGSADRAFHCSQCDGTFTCRVDLHTHTERQHADESMPAFQLRADGHCWCSNLPSGDRLTLFKPHLILGHSVLIRGYPGPRVDPYKCPLCSERLDYEALIQHMAGAHGWVFKTLGEEYVGSANPRSMEVGCPLCHKTENFERLFHHMQEKHQWTFKASAERQRDKRQSKPRPVVVSKAHQLVKRAVEQKIGSKGDPMTAKAKRLMSSASSAKSTIFECPFCDAFFPSIREYTAHARRGHSGLMTNKLKISCEVKYCYTAVRGNHKLIYHKDFAKRTHHCDKCDVAVQRGGELTKHRRNMHIDGRPPVRVLGVLCHCASSRETVSLPHLWGYHMKALRGPVGPRVQPYTCPECAVSLRFYELVRHLKLEHRWNLKECGTSVFQEDAEHAEGSSGTVSRTMEQTEDEIYHDGDKAKAGRQANVKRTSVRSFVDHPRKHDCPFCDAFFMDKKSYFYHGKMSHSGLSLRIGVPLCKVKYCYVSVTGEDCKHATRLHKGAKVFKDTCSLCDRCFKTSRSLKHHINGSHPTQRSVGEQGNDASDCLCKGPLVGKPMQHVTWNHSIQVRSYPGPRARPYSCPECFELFLFRDLLDHLPTKHGWQLKTTGEEAFGADRLNNRNFRESACRSEDEAIRKNTPHKMSPAKKERTEMAGGLKQHVTAATYSRNEDHPIGSGKLTVSFASKAAVLQTQRKTSTSEIIACPLCDSFHQSVAAYKEHAQKAHSGFMRPENMCRVAYCYAKTKNGHKAMYHKHLVKQFQCKSCDAVFPKRFLFFRHLRISHKFTVSRPSDGKAKSACSCSVANVKMAHLLSCHTVSLRGRPGPRSQPYMCPGKDCDLRMSFANLLTHLEEVHQWRLKNKGLPAYPQLHPPKPTSRIEAKPGDKGSHAVKSSDCQSHNPTSANVLPPPVMAKPVERESFKPKTTYMCSYCTSFSGTKDEIFAHRKAEHSEAHDAFLRFAATCVSAKGIYTCPFCMNKTKTRSAFRRHMSRSADCRHRLGPEACWLEDPEKVQILKRARRVREANERRVREEKEAAETEDITEGIGGVSGTGKEASSSGLQRQRQRAASVKAKLLLSEGDPEMYAERQVPTGVVMTFACHFCDVTGRKADVRRHRQQAHGEALRVFTSFAQSCVKKQRTSDMKRYQCPFCPFNRKEIWRLKDHFSSSVACKNALEPVNLCWVSSVPAQEHSDNVSSVPTGLTSGDKSSSLSPQRKVTLISAPVKRMITPKGSKPKPLFKCHFCPFSSDKTTAKSHRKLVHPKAYGDFLAFAARQKTGDHYRCPHCRSLSMELWKFKQHMCNSNRCIQELGLDNTSWLNTGMRVKTEDEASLSQVFESEVCPDLEVEDAVDVADDSMDIPIEDVLKREPLEIPDDGPEYGASAEEFILPDVEPDNSEMFHPDDGGGPDANDDVDYVADPGSNVEEGGSCPADDSSPPLEPDNTAASTRWAPPSAPPCSSSPIHSAAAGSADSSVSDVRADQRSGSNSGTFECLKCAAKFAQKELLIAHSQNQHSINRKKRSLSPDRSQPRIDMFFKRVKVEPLD